MLQLIQDLKSGKTSLLEVPVPKVKPGTVLIKTNRSLVSIGTERTLVEFGKANIINKARQQPEKVAMVLDKMQTEGVIPTLEAVFKKLDQPIPLGYCNVGTVIDVGTGVSEFQIGNRVVSNGPHAEFVCVPQNLVAPIPDGVTDDNAAFTVIGAIGLQGIRLCQPTLGETIVVMGLGLIGLITAQLLKLNGCNVIGIDIDEGKNFLAREMGIECINPNLDGDPVSVVKEKSGITGVDGVIITASTSSNELIGQAARMCRKRGRIILVGVVGLNLSRSEFYEKELSFQVSCSYGPGRYDTNYEEHGVDYPMPFVRWTENRNFRAILNSLDGGGLKVDSLITERVELKNFNQVYGDLRRPNVVASILKYSEGSVASHSLQVTEDSRQFTGGKVVVGIIGAGNFTKMTLLPSLVKSDCQIKYISSKDGLNSTVLARKYGIPNSVTDYQLILNDPEVNLVIITTRHDQHASLVRACLAAGKNTFVEKPLCLNRNELSGVIEAYDESQGKHAPILTVGFNRRFAPLIKKAKQVIGTSGRPINVVITVNAGFIPENSWVHDLKVGGGRIIGEGCHFIDLISHLCESPVVAVCTNGTGLGVKADTDNASILLKLSNGSTGVVNYFSNGNKRYSKERVEIHAGGKSLVLDNFRTLTAYGYGKFKSSKTKMDKGHDVQFYDLVEAIKNSGGELIPFKQIINATEASFAAVESISQGGWVKI